MENSALPRVQCDLLNLPNTWHANIIHIHFRIDLLRYHAESSNDSKWEPYTFWFLELVGRLKACVSERQRLLAENLNGTWCVD